MPSPKRSMLCALVATAVLLATGAAGGAAIGNASWLGWGNGQQRWNATASSLSGPLGRRFVLPLPGKITNQVLAANGSFFVATSDGTVAAFDSNGFERWRVNVGQFAQTCKQLPGYGVTGTGVIDPAAGTLYVADAFGRLHALSLATGKERAGWPVQVYTDNDKQLDWAGLTLVDGAVYVPVAAYCDASSLGGVYRVDVATKAVTDWVPVPASLGGGGGPWGWGGLAYSPADRTLFAATSNTFSGGTNVGSAFSESAGYGEHLVQLTPGLTVKAASHPADLVKPLDLDLTGSPLVITRKGCGELVTATDKDDTIYGWKAGSIAAGPIWEVSLETFNPGIPMVSQLAWSQATSSLYAVTGTHFDRIKIGANCSATAVWKIPLGTITENGSPTVAGNSVWLAVNKTAANTLNGYNATTGALEQRLPLGGITLTAPAVLNGELLIGTFTGLVEGFATGASAGSVESPPAQPGTPTEVSRLDAKHEWESRSDGVYTTENGGKSWRRIYPHPANALLRLSATSGVIDVPTSPLACMCSTRKLWTTDAGRTWHVTREVGDGFTGAGKTVYWWEGGALHQLANFAGKAPRTSDLLTVANGTIVDAAAVPGGVVAVVSNRVLGQNWDSSPRVAVIRGASKQLITLPAQVGSNILAQGLTVNWPHLTITGTDYDSTQTKRVTWVSANGGSTWAVG